MQFILQKSEKPSQVVNNKQEIKSGEQESHDKLADVRQTSNLLEKQSENVGIVKGIPQKSSELSSAAKVVLSIGPDNNSGKGDAAKDRKASFGHFQADNGALHRRGDR